MKLHRIGKKIIVRPYKEKDFIAWRSSFLSILPKQKNVWDIRHHKNDDKLKQTDFKKILRTQKKNRQKDSFFDLGIFLKDGTLVGGVSIMDISRLAFQNAYIGYYIFNNHWGKGYGKEAVKLAIDIAFKDLKLHRLEAGIEPKNKRSIALAKSVGMKWESFSRRRLYLRNKWLDMSLYVIKSEDVGIQWKP